ncbi:hypothetical protein FTV92_12360 [Escherichia coli]|nr:hypothetical protein FTV92_12360 [Escherichia coli]
MICQSVRCFNGLTCRTKWLWVFIPISDEKLNRCKYVICPVSPLRAKLSEVKRRLPVVTGTMASLPVALHSVICARYSNWHSNVGDGVTGGSGRSCGVNVFMSVPTDLPHLSS